MHVYVWQADQFHQPLDLICPRIKNENNLKLSTLDNVALRSEAGRDSPYKRQQYNGVFMSYCCYQFINQK